METQVRTPQLVFMQPQRLVVPLFQRPYVWNQENQWEPLWNDVVRLAERLLGHPFDRHYPHFLGAVVLQQVQKPTGMMQERTIIDGQQRLTTLQLLLDALHAELVVAGAQAPAMRIEPLVANGQAFCSKPEDKFKVWPTNRDRPAFNAVMGATPPVDYDELAQRGEKMVEAHRYFSEQARQWLSSAGTEQLEKRSAAIETVVRDLLQMVVIDLAADENAQEIFETLNARGAQLTAADLIKNFVFQRMLESGADVERSYEQHWKEFETGYWEAEVSVGRLRYQRSSVFLNHWLIARTGSEVVAREVFSRFKTFADFESRLGMPALLEQIHRAGTLYQQRIAPVSPATGVVDRLGLFVYRTNVLESEVIKPFLLYLLDPELPPLPREQLYKALEVVESWLVRRMLVRATTKNYNQVIAELIGILQKSDRSQTGERIESFLSAQTSGSKYWPDDEDVRTELRDLLAYRLLGRGRLRMVLEAIEDYLRGWSNGRPGLGEERVTRGRYAVEHVMPRKWSAHWPAPDGAQAEAERDRLIHTLGNLTLLGGKLNTKVSNRPWLGPGGKREQLQQHDVLLLNRNLIKAAGELWTDEAIRLRTAELADIIVKIWPVPAGHHSGFAQEKPRRRRMLTLPDLLAAGSLQPGMTLVPRRKQFADQVATLLADGRIDVKGTVFSTPHEAATAIRGKRTGGWWFFLVDPVSQRSLRDVRREYIEALEIDTEEDEGDDDVDDDDA